ncbi:hypothetical protein GCM10008014_15360 [Paenibacillus silvae]|uniref:Uncharacterized protein n=1 Tax=Paenibacillus silvae TaxID=1325358 RepID=A0ABQ1Z734_9BACL|nr:Abi-alpha family protein [Paenibacillus silvae]GGH50326.1 hypothetical protein GCM10008014_15360 [Paenibacillus silvae]
MWSNLLTDTVISEKNHENTASFIDVLKQLTPTDAKVLLFIHSWVKPYSPYFDKNSEEFLTELEQNTSVTKKQLHDMLYRKFFRLGLVNYILENQGILSAEEIIKDMVKALQTNDYHHFDLESYMPIQNNYDWVCLSSFSESFIEAVQNK